MLEIMLAIMSVVAGVAVGILFVRENMARAAIAKLKLECKNKADKIKELEDHLADVCRIKEGLN